MTLEKCKKCGKELKDDVSLNRGYGPKCWESVDKTKILVTYLKDEKMGITMYEKGVSERICISLAEKYDNDIVVFLGFQNPFNYHPDVSFLILMKQDLINYDFETKYPDGVNPLKVEKHKYVPVAMIEDFEEGGCPGWEETLIDSMQYAHSFKCVFDRLTKTKCWFIPEFGAADRDKQTHLLIDYDFKHTVFEVVMKDYDWSDLGESNELETDLERWGAPIIDEMLSEDRWNMVLEMKGDETAYESLCPVGALEISEDLHPMAETWKAWYNIIRSSDFCYEEGDYSIPVMGAIDKAIEIIADIVIEDQYVKWGLDFLVDYFNDTIPDHQCYESKRLVVEMMKGLARR
jgi:hypothetical protein